MRRAAIIVAAGAIAVMPTLAAHAGEETPRGTFSSPTRAVAGQPIFVRSITPCPVITGEYQYVQVGYPPQSELQSPHVEWTQADLFADGSWEVTLSAPTDMPKGITRSYDIHAQCLVDEAPYFAPDRDPTVTTSTLPPVYSIQRYVSRRIQVTGFGESDASEEALAGDGSTPTTSSSTTSTTDPSVTTTTSIVIATTTTTTLPDFFFSRDEKQRAAEARAELAAQQGRRSSDVALSSTPASSTSPVPSTDGGAPWWSFVLATVLAVGAVVGYGAKRGSGA